MLVGSRLVHRFSPPMAKLGQGDENEWPQGSEAAPKCARDFPQDQDFVCSEAGAESRLRRLAPSPWEVTWFPGARGCAASSRDEDCA